MSRFGADSVQYACRLVQYEYRYRVDYLQIMCRFEVILFKEVAKCFIEKREKQELRFLLGERMRVSLLREDK